MSKNKHKKEVYVQELDVEQGTTITWANKTHADEYEAQQLAEEILRKRLAKGKGPKAPELTEDEKLDAITAELMREWAK